MRITNLQRSADERVSGMRRTTALAAIGLLALTFPLGAGSSGQTNLYMPQGAAAGTANGDYIIATTGLNTYYSYYVEVPPSLSRLVVELFDVDFGAGGGGEAAAQRDRGRGAFDSDAQYELRNPAGAVIASATNASGADNAWYTLFDSSTAAVSFVAAATATSDADVTSIGVALPAGIVSTDFLLAFIARDAEAAPGAVTAPAGWTLLNEGACGGGVACSLAVFQRFTGSASGPQTFTWTGGQNVTAALLAYRNVNQSTPFDTAATTSTGTTGSPGVPAITTVTNNSMVVRAVAESEEVGPFTPPGGHTERFDLNPTGGGATTNIASSGADFVDATAGANAATTFDSTGGSSAWRGISIALRPGLPENGHYEIRVDSTGGNDLNAIGVRAHDGTAGAGGTELPVYYDSHTQFGVNPVTNPTSRDYDVFPWITNGCQGVISTFDFDAENAASQGSIALTSPLSVPGGTAYTQTVADGALSPDDTWTRNTFGPWTTDSRSTRYGIWRADVNIQTYDNGALNGNYTNMYMAPSTQPADPPSQPEVGVYRIYLPTDVSDTTMPVKPYIEQLVTWLSGPNPPSVGVQTIFQRHDPRRQPDAASDHLLDADQHRHREHPRRRRDLRRFAGGLAGLGRLRSPRSAAPATSPGTPARSPPATATRRSMTPRSSC